MPPKATTAGATVGSTVLSMKETKMLASVIHLLGDVPDIDFGALAIMCGYQHSKNARTKCKALLAKIKSLDPPSAATDGKHLNPSPNPQTEGEVSDGEEEDLVMESIEKDDEPAIKKKKKGAAAKPAAAKPAAAAAAAANQQAPRKIAPLKKKKEEEEEEEEEEKASSPPPSTTPKKVGKKAGGGGGGGGPATAAARGTAKGTPPSKKKKPMKRSLPGDDDDDDDHANDAAAADKNVKDQQPISLSDASRAGI